MGDTHRLYYTDSRLTEFTTHVVAVKPAEGQTAIRLEQTAFYPTSGGQPHDTGWIEDQPVVDVVDGEDGSVWHVVDGSPTLAVGETVAGRIDWPRRFDHMQQHTGQHILSAELARLLGAQTVGFHLGVEAATIDLDRSLAPEDMAVAELAANVVVWNDRPVDVRFVTPEEAVRLELRKPSRRSGRLRLVEIAGCDLSACGGTHVARTGAIGVIGVTTSERYKGGTRVGFVCGERALRAFQSLRHQVRRAVTLLSVGPAELAEAVERSQQERHAQRRVVRALRERLVSTDAAELMATGQSVRGATVVLATRSGHDAKSLMSIAVRVARAPGYVVVLVSDTRPVSLVVSRSADVDLDANAVVGAVTARWDARGGGRRDLAQAGGLDADPSEVLATAGTLVTESLAG